ncbi:MAG: hypothetical protein NFCOHLIN_01906 [Gammaproteobacteria bacterium]|nr:hypothetical protein [Gammaproteobacteria bacterium]
MARVDSKCTEETHPELVGRPYVENPRDPDSQVGTRLGNRRNRLPREPPWSGCASVRLRYESA